METTPAQGVHMDGAPHKPAILVVDDSLTVRMDLVQIFESAGFEVSACETLAAAQEALRRQAPALVVLDVLLPDGDGLDLLRQIKTNLSARPPVLLLSTEAEMGDRLRGLKTGADDYVSKPYDAGYVLKRARELIGAVGHPPEERPARLVLIDDSATARQQFKAILEGAGYSVLTCESGEEGLRTAFDVRPEAIIVDRRLPGGMDGDDVIRRVKQDLTLQNTPCLLFTGSSLAGEELGILEAGADACLSKDVDAEVFLARLAALIRSRSAAPALEPSPFSMLGAKKILAVDDSPTYLDELSVQLRQDGYDVVQATSGSQALELLDVQLVDGILLDMRMPGLSGIETCRRIKQRPDARGIPLLMLTAAEGSESLIEGINAGADDYVGKSGDVTVLKARLRAQLRRKQFEDEYRYVNQELLKKELEATQARARQEIAEARAAMVDELESKNRELEAFSWAVTHDLRSPLRTIRGFSQALLQDFAERLPEGAATDLKRIYAAALRMGQLIDTLLELSRTTRADLRRQPTDLSQVANAVAADLAESSPGRRVDYSAEPDMVAYCDPGLMRIVFNNLIGNAWKFTAKTSDPKIRVGAIREGPETVYFVQDNGAGFDPRFAEKLFRPFERLHPATDFPGAGIGLATVRRIIERHRGQIWAKGAIDQGARLSFTLGSRTRRRSEDCPSRNPASAVLKESV